MLQRKLPHAAVVVSANPTQRPGHGFGSKSSLIAVLLLVVALIFFQMPPNSTSSTSNALPSSVKVNDLSVGTGVSKVSGWSADNLLCKRFFSQFGQDRQLFARYWKQWGDRKGFYVDVAAAHYEKNSNSYYLDRCLGWSGICVEAHPVRAAALRAHRTCVVVDTCVSETEGRNVTFWAPIFGADGTHTRTLRAHIKNHVML
jgi:hypothetical protein